MQKHQFHLSNTGTVPHSLCLQLQREAELSSKVLQSNGAMQWGITFWLRALSHRLSSPFGIKIAQLETSSRRFLLSVHITPSQRTQVHGYLPFLPKWPAVAEWSLKPSMGKNTKKKNTTGPQACRTVGCKPVKLRLTCSLCTSPWINVARCDIFLNNHLFTSYVFKQKNGCLSGTELFMKALQILPRFSEFSYLPYTSVPKRLASGLRNNQSCCQEQRAPADSKFGGRNMVEAPWERGPGPLFYLCKEPFKRGDTH